MNPPVLEMDFKTPKVNTPFSAGGSFRLNLGGCGEGYRESRIPGFLVVDLREGADIQSDISWLPMFKDDSVKEIYASNCLEHFPHTKTVEVLSEWRRILEPSGKLWVSVPDLMASCRLILEQGQCDWTNYLVWGDQSHPLNYHYINFTYGFLAKLCIDAGFSDCKRIESLPFGLRDASEHRDNITKKRISLNCEVTK